MKEAGFEPDAIRTRREEESYKIIQEVRKMDEFRIRALHSEIKNGESFGLHIYPSSTSESICP